jgi:hypothetical protein
MTTTAEYIPRIEKLETLAQRRGGGGGSLVGFGASTVVWRPGGVTAGNVYATWAEVVAAVAALQGDVTVGVDVDLAAAVIPVGAWDLRPAGVSGPVTLVNASKTDPAPFVTVANAVVTIHGLSGLTNVQIDNHATVDLITATPTNRVDFFMRGLSSIFQSIQAAGAAFLRVSGGGGGPFAPTAQLYVSDFGFVSTLDGGSNAIQVTGAGSIIDLFINDEGIFDTNQLVAGAGGAAVTVAAVQVTGINPYTTQAGAPTAAPFGLVIRGSAAIVVGTGKTAAIPAFVTAASRILVSLKTPVGDANTVKYAALAADRVNGNPGSFQISALVAAGGGAVNGADTSTIDYEISTV